MKRDNFKMGNDSIDCMASFASVAQSGSSAAFSPSRSSTSDVTSPTLCSNSSGSPFKDTLLCFGSNAERTNQSEFVFDSVKVNQSELHEKSQGGQSASERVLDKSCNREGVTKSDSTVKDRFTHSLVNTSSESLQCSEIVPKKILLGVKRGIKRKHRKLKFTNVKRFRKLGPEKKAAGRQSVDLDDLNCPVRSSVCSESQPLPILHCENDCPMLDDEALGFDVGKSHKR